MNFPNGISNGNGTTNCEISWNDIMNAANATGVFTNGNARSTLNIHNNFVNSCYEGIHLEFGSGGNSTVSLNVIENCTRHGLDFKVGHRA